MPLLPRSLHSMPSWLLVLLAACAGIYATAEEVPSLSHNLRQRHIQQAVQENIVGGTAATLGAYPYYGISKSGPLCGATLIHTDIAVTAGHCAGVFLNVGLLLGGVKLNGQDAVEDVVVLQEYRHLNFNSNTLENDILLLKLQRTGGTVRPIRTINANATLPTVSSTVTTIGFGTTTEGGTLAATLQQVAINVLDSTTCAAQYWNPLINQKKISSMLCAAATGKDAGQGDSGGPLLQKKSNGALMLVGLVSWGVGCARAGNPGVYTRMSAFADFIHTGICTLSNSKPTSCRRQ